MSGLCGKSAIPVENRQGRECGARRRPILAADARRRPGNDRLAALGLALGYLGLVAILTIAPFWQQAAAPHQPQPLVCTDFGGSR